MLKTRSIVTVAMTMMVAGVLVAAEPAKDSHEHKGEHAEIHFTKAIVGLVPTEGNHVTGWLTITATKDGVKITGDVNGLTPGKHGFHIHEFGDLSDPAGKAAGGHYNPGGHQHGGPDSDHRHAGDLGNITAGDDGVAHVKIHEKGLHIHHILGRSIVVHAGADDLKSQPSGDAGPRVAVGIIGLAAEPKK